MSLSYKNYSLFFFCIIFIIPFLIGSSNRINNNLIINEDERFYLSNYSSYSPGSIITVNLYSHSHNNDDFNFRLLRISDPSKFFSEADINSLKNGFDILGKEKEVLLKYTELIKEWKQRFYFKSNNNLSIGTIKEPGIYILQAIRGEQVGYCGISVSDLAMIYKYSGKQILAFVSNARTSEFIKNVKFDLYSQNKLVESKLSDKDGLVLFDIKERNIDNNNNNSAFIIAQTDDEVVLSDPYFYFRQQNNNYTAYIYTNQPIYRPGQEVFFKAIIREKAGNQLLNADDEEFTVTIKSPKNKEVFSDILRTNEFGSLTDNFILNEAADLGNYNIQLTKGNLNYHGSFSVEEYKKPEFIVNVNTGKSHYSSGDLIEGKVTADYYFGSPVTEGKVTINIYKKNYWRPWWYWTDYAWFYKNFYNDRYYGGGDQQLVHQHTGEFDDNGEYFFSYRIDDKVDADYVYDIHAEVTDNSRRVIPGTAQAYVTRGSFNLSTSPEKYFVERGKNINIRINAVDFSEKPVLTDFKILIRYPNQNKPYDPNIPNDYDITLNGKTDKHGKALIEYSPSYSYNGHYNYLVIANDEKKREITASNSFFVGDKDHYYYGRTSSGLEIVTDKDSYDKGDSLIAFVFLPQKDLELLITYESSELINYKKIKTSENNFTIKEKLTDKFSPGFNITIAYMYDRQFYSTSKLIGVLAKDKFLDITLTPSKEIYKPGEEAEYIVSVKDYKGNPVKNTELSFGIIDESIYAIKEDAVQNIQNFFYMPSYSYIPTYNSLQRNYFNGQSRPVTYIDKYYFEKSGINQNNKKKGVLYGKVTSKNSSEGIEGAYLILSSETNFYKAVTDKEGKYLFKDAVINEYNLYVVTKGTELKKIGQININKLTENNFELDETIIEELDFAGQEVLSAEVSIRGGRNGDVMFRMDNAVPMMKSMSEKKDVYIEAQTRSNFVDALIWKAHVITDNNGSASVKFKIPDNLTTWRATAKGITVNSEAGQQTNKVISRKDLLVRMETPRFFREGDELTISTIVHNYLNQNKKTKITFNVENLELINSKINSPGFTSIISNNNNEYEITVDKDSEVRIDWIVKVTTPIGEAKLTAEALTNEESDAVELKVPILPKGFKEVKSLVADFSGNGNEELSFNIPADTDLRTVKLSFTINPSLGGTILKALDDLVGYPYGCVEQTMSRFLPTIVVANTFKEIDAPLKANTIVELPKMVEAGLKRLYNFQHSDGGWGWWTNDATHPYMTAYVVYGMSLSKQAGYELDEKIFTSGLENLKNQIENYKGNEGSDETTLAYMIYSLTTALKGSEYNTSLYEELIKIMLNKELNPYSLSLLTISSNNINKKELTENITGRLRAMVKEESSYAYWEGQQWHYNWQNDNVQGTAFALKALLITEPNSSLITKSVRWLMQQKRGYSWRSTQETAVVIFALSDYLKVTQEMNPDFNTVVYLNDKKVFEKHFTKEDIFTEPASINITGLKDNILKPGKNYIEIIKEGEGKLYFSGLNEYYSKNQIAAAKVSKFNIKREYHILKPEQRDGRIVYVKKDFKGTVASGEDILIKTSVESDEANMQYFILEDMLPSGFETVKDEENYVIEGENDYNYYDHWNYRPWRWFYADKEYRDEKVVFFVTNANNSMNFSYIMKAQIPGEYTAMPANGFLMYYPEVSSSSGMINIKVEEE